ncbi:cellulose binding domain-containing protein [Streptomyces sp. NPDC088725]|uniref:cellulose binding domain-containing protein n=1 Tax=Streptomyces sp. NPDC088725 TaxID=3365873 RepID=UPI00383095F5
MGSSGTQHRRRANGRTKAIGAVVAAAVIGGAAFALTGTAQAASVGAAYTETSSWQGGYTGQYVVTNDTDKARSDWTLTFDLPAGTEISSLWNGEHTVDGQHVTVTPQSWNKELAPGQSVTIGFVTAASGDDEMAAAPTGCVIDGATCSVDEGATPEPTGRPTEEPASEPTSEPTGGPTYVPTTPPDTGNGTKASAGFAPYVDTSLYPAYDLLDTATKTGVKEFTLAFITSGGSCEPLWGGVTAVGSDAVAAQIGDLRAEGGDVRVSFGGASGTELAAGCTSASALAEAYGKVIDGYGLTKADFDIEGAALPDAAVNTRRAQAVAQLQKSHPDLDVSFTLPVMPEGLTQPGIGLLADARENGVKIGAVNIMAMDYGASYRGDMGEYATQAATATQAQIKEVLGLSDAAAWQAVAVTPMIGVNDVNTEIFTVDNANRLADFAKSKGLGRLSMWSATRDKACPGGPKDTADASCSSIDQDPLAFTKAFGANQ